MKDKITIGVGISYRKMLSFTIDRILEGISEVNYPINVRVSGGLDGSGCHRVYQQVIDPELATKNFFLFGFKILTITSNNGETIWKNQIPNSPFSIRPITLLALPENEENVKFLMNTMINEERVYRN